jgi:ribonuclease G
LRDLGGIIIIDFIDMKLPDNRKKLYDEMEKLMANDRAKHTLLPISKFGLMQITRQRLRPEINISTSEVCPECKGTGKIGPSLILGDEIEKDFKYLIGQGHRYLSIHVNPILGAYLTKGMLFNSIIAKWKKKYGVKLKVVENTGSTLTQYQFFDTKTEEFIKL